MRNLKQPRAIETRKRILREAALLYALKGFHDTKVEELIQAAEVTSGAFFHHFRGKDDLAFAVIDHHMEERCRTLDRIEKGLPPADDHEPLERVFRRLDAACEMIVRRRNKKGGCLIGNLSTTLSDTRPEFRRRLGECFDEMAAEFQVHLAEAAADRGLTDEVDAWEIARYIVSVIEGAIILSRTHRDIGLIERQIQRLKDDIKRSIQAQAVTSR
jgi:TetR/AcrR family transcriptional repressor of nem operon